jgi:hypothetical protein
MVRHAPFPRVPAHIAQDAPAVREIAPQSSTPLQPADDRVRLRMEILATVCQSPLFAGRLNWQDLPELLRNVEATVTERRGG